jgi:Trypsin-like peptidase domain
MRAHHHIWLLAILLAICVESSADPVPVKNLLFKPTFVTANESFTAGTAFLCEYPDRKVIVLMTAQHLLGHAGGFPAELPWDSLNETIKLTTAISMDNPDIHISSKRAVLIEGAHALDKTGLQNDMAVFEVDSANAQPALKLAENSPAAGDRIWLYGRQRDSKVVELFRGTVILSSPRELRFVYDANDIRLPGTSGAPVLNSGGDVVAINIGGYARDGKLVGYGNPMSSIRDHLRRAMKDRS